MNNKKIIFDLQASPPEENALAAARAERRPWCEHVDKWIALGCIPLLGLPLLSFWFLGAAIFAVLVVSAVRIRHLDYLDRAEKERYRLEPVTPDSDPDAYLKIADLAEQDPIIRHYFDEIAAQGRMPVRGELDAATAWVNGAGPRSL